MIIENPGAFSAFKNIRALLPSVQHKIAHNALIKLLLDQGRDFHKSQHQAFEKQAAALEKILRHRQIPFDLFYHTDKPVVMTDSDSWQFSFPTGFKIIWTADRLFSLYCVQTLLGQPATDPSLRQMTPLEQQILVPFYTLLAKQFALNDGQPTVTVVQHAPDKGGEVGYFALKTNGKTVGLRVQLIKPTLEPIENDWENKLARHVLALNLPVRGVLHKTIPLNAFLNLKKGDTLTFFNKDDTRIWVQTNGHPLTQGRLKSIDAQSELMIETEEK